MKMPTFRHFVFMFLPLHLFLVSCGSSNSTNPDAQDNDDSDPVVVLPPDDDSSDGSGTPAPVPDDAGSDNNPGTDGTHTGPGFGTGQSNDLPIVNTLVTLPNQGYLNLDPTIQAMLPSDCIAELYYSIYCFSTEDRTLMAISSGGEPRWNFQLPGDNATNRIEGLHVLSIRQLAIVANTTNDPANSQHEISLFDTSGEFCCTYSLFDNFLNLAGQATDNRLSVNIQGEPLLSAANLETDSEMGTRNSRLFVAGNYYELIDGGNASQIGDWRHRGVVINSINVDTGIRRLTRMIPGALISDVDNDSLAVVNTELVLTLNGISYTFDTDLDDGRRVVRDAPLTTEHLYRQIPAKVTELRGGYAVMLRDLLESTIPADQQTIDQLDCDYPNPDSPPPVSGRTCSADSDLTTELCHSGEYSESYTIEKTFIGGGTGEMIVRTRSINLDSCKLGSTEFSGQVNQVSVLGGVRRGGRDSSQFTFSDFEVENHENGQPLVYRYGLDGKLLESVTTGTFDGSKLNRNVQTTNFEYHIRSLDTIPTVTNPVLSAERRITNHSYNSDTIRSDTAPSFTETGSLDVTLNDNITQYSEISFSDTPPASGYGASGLFTIDESSGATIQVTPLNNGQLTDFLVEFSDASGTPTVYQMPAEGLRAPWVNSTLD